MVVLVMCIPKGFSILVIVFGVDPLMVYGDVENGNGSSSVKPYSSENISP